MQLHAAGRRERQARRSADKSPRRSQRETRRRRQGAGRALLALARDQLLAAGAKRVYLEVRQSNKSAQALYFSAGYAIHSLRKDYYRNPNEDALVLGWELRPPSVDSQP